MLFIGFIIEETNRAFLFQDHWWAGADWLPRSQVDIIRSDTTYEVKVMASAWICNKKGIEEFRARSAEEIEEARKA